MAAQEWIDVPLNTKVFENVPEEALTRAHAALENAFVTEAEGVSRFPGLKDFVDTGGAAEVFLAPDEFRGDMIAARRDGRVFRIDEDGNKSDVTGVPITGGSRVTFTEADDAMLMAAGGQIIRFAGITTEVLSEDAPLATHVAYLDNFVFAGEKDSGRWQHSTAGAFRSWDPLDVLAASGFPDPITAILVTPYGEILFGGPKSIEQFERLPSGDPPFFRRWYNGEGILAPYTLGFADNAAFFVNKKYELVRLSGQTGQPLSDDIGRKLQQKTLAEWVDAWATEVQVEGQKFIVLSLPNATNPYGGKGLAYKYDYRQQRWGSLYGWDAARGVPAAWPGVSFAEVWGRRFVGGKGKIYELTTDTYLHAGTTARMLLRTAHLSALGTGSIDNLRMRVKRGTGTYSSDAKISVRVNPDNRGFRNWARRSLGKRGEREMHIEFGGFGEATTWQFEIEVTDDTPVEIAKLQAQFTPSGW